MKNCDTDSAFCGAHFCLETTLCAGTDLDLLENDAEMHGRQMVDCGEIEHMDCCLRSLLQLILNLQGKSSNAAILTEAVHNQTDAMQATSISKDQHHVSHLAKDMPFAAAFFGDWKRGAKVGEKHIGTVCGTLVSQRSVAVSRFITGVSCFDEACRTGKKKFLAIAKKNLKIVQSASLHCNLFLSVLCCFGFDHSRAQSSLKLVLHVRRFFSVV